MTLLQPPPHKQHTQVRRALAGIPGEIVWHLNRLCVQTTQLGAAAATASGALLVGAGGGPGGLSAGKLVEPRSAVELNNALERAALELAEAEAEVRRGLSLAAAAVLADLETQLDIVATLDSIALRARRAAATAASALATGERMCMRGRSCVRAVG